MWSLGSRLVVLLFVLALVASGCARPAADQVVDEVLPTVGHASGLLLAYGTVERSGEPVADASVVLQAAPVTSASDDGVGAQRWSAPVVKSDQDGHWALRLDPADIPKAYFPDSASFLEFDLVFGDGTRLTLWSGMVFLRTDPSLWRTEGAGPSEGVLRVDADLDSGDVVATDSSGVRITRG